MANPVQLSNADARAIPRNIASDVFTRATEQSAVMQRAQRVPVAMDAQTAIPVPLDIPLADWVSEGGVKPVSSGGVDVIMMQAKKIATLIPVSEEVVRTNPAGLYTQLQNDLPTAIARAFDHAAIHGKSMKGATGPFGSYLAQTSHTRVLGTSSQGTGGVYKDLVLGMQDVSNANYDFTGFVADPRLRPTLMLATDTVGRPIFVDTRTPGTGATDAGTLLGMPIGYSRGVAGALVRQSTLSDTGLRAVGGDWSQCAYGVGMDITIKVSNQASYVDSAGVTHSAFQENLVLLLAEAYYGFVVGHADAFVTYTSTPGS